MAVYRVSVASRSPSSGAHATVVRPSTTHVLGAVLMNLDQTAEAVPAFAQAVRHQRAALDGAPRDEKLRKVLSASHFHLAHVQREAGRLAESAAEAQLLCSPAEALAAEGQPAFPS